MQARTKAFWKHQTVGSATDHVTVEARDFSASYILNKASSIVSSCICCLYKLHVPGANLCHAGLKQKASAPVTVEGEGPSEQIHSL